MASAVSLELWYAALASENGVIVEVSDVERAKQRLYALRREANDLSLESISILTSPTNPTRDLWLVKRKDSNASD